MQESMLSESHDSNFKPDLIIPKSSLHLVMETARWGNFLSIIGFVFVGLIAVLAFSIGFIMENLVEESPEDFPFESSGIITVIYLLVALLYFFPCLYLYRFSAKMKAAVLSRDQDQLSGALENQKSLLKFMGILTIIGLAFYAIALLFAFLGFMAI